MDSISTREHPKLGRPTDVEQVLYDWLEPWDQEYLTPEVGDLFRAAVRAYLDDNGMPPWWPDDYSTMRVKVMGAVETIYLAECERRWPPTRHSRWQELVEGEIPDSGVQCVYRHWGSDGLLYVGVTGDFPARQSQHKASRWWDKVERVTVDLFRTRASAETAEKQAIRVENPLYNTQGRGR